MTDSKKKYFEDNVADTTEGQAMIARVNQLGKMLDHKVMQEKAKDHPNQSKEQAPAREGRTEQVKAIQKAQAAIYQWEKSEETDKDTTLLKSISEAKQDFYNARVSTVRKQVNQATKITTGSKIALSSMDAIFGDIQQSIQTELKPSLLQRTLSFFNPFKEKTTPPLTRSQSESNLLDSSIQFVSKARASMIGTLGLNKNSNPRENSTQSTRPNSEIPSQNVKNAAEAMPPKTRASILGFLGLSQLFKPNTTPTRPNSVPPSQKEAAPGPTAEQTKQTRFEQELDSVEEQARVAKEQARFEQGQAMLVAQQKEQAKQAADRLAKREKETQEKIKELDERAQKAEQAAAENPLDYYPPADEQSSGIQFDAPKKDSFSSSDPYPFGNPEKEPFSSTEDDPFAAASTKQGAIPTPTQDNRFGGDAFPPTAVNSETQEDPVDHSQAFEQQYQEYPDRELSWDSETVDFSGLTAQDRQTTVGFGRENLDLEQRTTENSAVQKPPSSQGWQANFDLNDSSSPGNTLVQSVSDKFAASSEAQDPVTTSSSTLTKAAPTILKSESTTSSPTNRSSLTGTASKAMTPKEDETPVVDPDSSNLNNLFKPDSDF